MVAEWKENENWAVEGGPHKFCDCLTRRRNKYCDNYEYFLIILLWYVTYLCVHECVLSCFSHVWLFAMLWTLAHQAPLSMGFSRQEYWNGLPCPLPGDLPDPGIQSTSLTSSTLIGRFFITSANWDFPGGASGKNLPASAGDIRAAGLIPELGKSPGGGHGNPFQYSCLENPHGERSLAGTVHEVAELDTTEWLSTSQQC